MWAMWHRGEGVGEQLEQVKKIACTVVQTQEWEKANIAGWVINQCPIKTLAAFS